MLCSPLLFPSFLRYIFGHRPMTPPDSAPGQHIGCMPSPPNEHLHLGYLSTSFLQADPQTGCTRPLRSDTSSAILLGPIRGRSLLILPLFLEFDCRELICPTISSTCCMTSSGAPANLSTKAHLMMRRLWKTSWIPHCRIRRRRCLATEVSPPIHLRLAVAVRHGQASRLRQAPPPMRWERDVDLG